MPKVIDLGVAKAVRRPLTKKTLFTGFTQMVGTPLHVAGASWLSDLDVGVRGDMSWLGVLLFRSCCTGRRRSTRIG